MSKDKPPTSDPQGFGPVGEDAPRKRMVKPPTRGGDSGRGESVKVKTSKRRTLSSNSWLARQLNDPFVALAKSKGYRARAAFKLTEIDDRFKLLHRGVRVVDLGCAPGGWLQVCVERGVSEIAGVDLLPVDPAPPAYILQMDFTDPACGDLLLAHLGGPPDLILSDMAPNTTGHRETDHLRIVGLIDAAIDFTLASLGPGGAFVAKAFQGAGTNEVLERLKQHFAKVQHVKPKASRQDSSELFLVATGFKGRPGRLSRLWSDLVQGLNPYAPGEQPRMPDLLKLNTNESPLGPSPHALAAIRAAADDTLRLYPDPQAAALCDALASYHGVQPQQVFVGNGSDEVLAHAFAALLKHDAPLLFPDITYSFYPVYCRLFDIAYRTIPVDDDALAVRLDDYRDAGAIILANPNAPTGVALSRAEIRALLTDHPDIPVVIDEAYVDFGAETSIPLVADHPNLLVVQTLSKSRALAGLRVGYAIGDVDLIQALTRVKDSFNSYPLGRLAQAGAIASLKDEAYFQHSREVVMESRTRLSAGLIARGFQVLPSSANFAFARHERMQGAALAAALRSRAVLVRHFNAPRISDFLRITVGTLDQTERLLGAVSAVLEDAG